MMPKTLNTNVLFAAQSRKAKSTVAASQTIVNEAFGPSDQALQVARETGAKLPDREWEREAETIAGSALMSMTYHYLWKHLPEEEFLGLFTLWNEGKITPEKLDEALAKATLESGQSTYSMRQIAQAAIVSSSPNDKNQLRRKIVENLPPQLAIMVSDQVAKDTVKKLKRQSITAKTVPWLASTIPLGVWSLASYVGSGTLRPLHILLSVLSGFVFFVGSKMFNFENRKEMYTNTLVNLVENTPQMTPDSFIHNTFETQTRSGKKSTNSPPLSLPEASAQVLETVDEMKQFLKGVPTL